MRRQEHKSAKGCCICRCKSSTSRFAKSGIWEKHFARCFLLAEGERKGDMCNACVLVVKRFSREGKEASYEWVVDSRRGPGSKNMSKIKKQKRLQKLENPIEQLLAEPSSKKKAPRKQPKGQIRRTLPLLPSCLDSPTEEEEDSGLLEKTQAELDDMWHKSFRRTIPVPPEYGNDLTGYEMCCGIMLYSSKTQQVFCLKKAYKICPLHLRLAQDRSKSKRSSMFGSTCSETPDEVDEESERGIEIFTTYQDQSSMEESSSLLCTESFMTVCE